MTPAVAAGPVVCGDLLVIGGGCYGSYHARQLDRARQRGRLVSGDLILVDRDPDSPARTEFAGRPGFRFVTAEWIEFVGGWIESLPADTDAQVIPTPFGPHLMLDVLRRRAMAAAGSAAVRPADVGAFPATPVSMPGPGGAGYLSYATWTCPTTCYEPRVCPHTRALRDWEMDDAVFGWIRSRQGAAGRIDLTALFRCRHLAWGIAAWPARLAVQAFRDLELTLAAARGDGRPRRLLVATVSSCHGIVGALEIG